MIRLLRALGIRVLLPMSWRRGDMHVARSLYTFSSVEADSAWQMLAAIKYADSSELKTSLFNNALEEVHHAFLFRNLAHSIEPFPVRLRIQERKRLIDETGDMLYFEAYHFVGERDVYLQFQNYAKAAPMAEARQLFQKLVADEEAHQAKAHEQLVQLTGSALKTSLMVARIRFDQMLGSLSRFGAQLGMILGGAMLLVIYIVFGPIAILQCRRQFRRAGQRKL